MNDNLDELDELEIKRQILGMFRMPATPPAPDITPASSLRESIPDVDDDFFQAIAGSIGTILICNKCGAILPVVESRIDRLVRQAGLDRRPAGEFYFTSEICFACSEEAAHFVPPLTVVLVDDQDRNPSEPDHQSS